MLTPIHNSQLFHQPTNKTNPQSKESQQSFQPKQIYFFGFQKPKIVNSTYVRTATMDEVEVEDKFNLHSYRIHQLANSLQCQANWYKVSSISNIAMEMLYKIEQQGISVLFLEHTVQGSFGPFQPTDKPYFANMINKLKLKAFNNARMKVNNIGLLGCQVTLEWKISLRAATGLRILTLPHYPNTYLLICNQNIFRYFSGNRIICQGPLHTITQYMS